MARWGYTSAIAGAIAWLLLFVAWPGGDSMRSIERLILLAALVIIPVALPLVAPTEPAMRYTIPFHTARLFQPIAALLAIGAFLLPAGILAALLASGWLLVTGLVALFGLGRLLVRGVGRADEACIDAGLLYLPVGGAWMFAARLGINPLGFGDTIVILTAAHFHYAGFAAPLLAGLAGRRLARVQPPLWKLFRLVAAGVVAGIPLVAAGISLSRSLEVVSALLLAASLVGLALLILFAIVPAIRPRAAQVLLAVSAASVVMTMLFACAYALGPLAGVTIITIPQMVLVHGWVNALGFVLCGLLAWTILASAKP